MQIAVTGATGFLGRYIVRLLAGEKHALRCWKRPASDTSGFENVNVEWLVGGLGDASAAARLVCGCDAVVHAALDRPGSSFRGGEGEVVPFVETNLLGTLKLIEAAHAAGITRFVFISTCAVYERILADRPLDEAHPLLPASHYGAHKAAIEKFAHSYGQGQGFPICAIRPTGIYGLDHPAQASKWFDLVRAIVRGEPVNCRTGGKEVHVADVARGVSVLLSAEAEAIAGEAFNCYDLYVSQWDVAILAKKFSNSTSVISGGPTAPKNQIVTEKLRALGMKFGGRPLLEKTIEDLVALASR